MRLTKKILSLIMIISIVCATVVMPASVSAAVDGTNLFGTVSVSGGSVSTSGGLQTSGWNESKWAALGSGATFAAQTDGSVLVSGRAAATDGLQYQYAPVRVGRSYKISAKIKLKDAASSTARIVTDVPDPSFNKTVVHQAYGYATGKTYVEPRPANDPYTTIEVDNNGFVTKGNSTRKTTAFSTGTIAVNSTNYTEVWAVVTFGENRYASTSPTVASRVERGANIAFDVNGVGGYYIKDLTLTEITGQNLFPNLEAGKGKVNTYMYFYDELSGTVKTNPEVMTPTKGSGSPAYNDHEFVDSTDATVGTYMRFVNHGVKEPTDNPSERSGRVLNVSILPGKTYNVSFKVKIPATENGVAVNEGVDTAYAFLKVGRGISGTTTAFKGPNKKTQVTKSDTQWYEVSDTMTVTDLAFWEAKNHSVGWEAFCCTLAATNSTNDRAGIANLIYYLDDFSISEVKNNLVMSVNPVKETETERVYDINFSNELAADLSSSNITVSGGTANVAVTKNDLTSYTVAITSLKKNTEYTVQMSATDIFGNTASDLLTFVSSQLKGKIIVNDGFNEDTINTAKWSSVNAYAKIKKGLRPEDPNDGAVHFGLESKGSFASVGKKWPQTKGTIITSVDYKFDSSNAGSLNIYFLGKNAAGTEKSDAISFGISYNQIFAYYNTTSSSSTQSKVFKQGMAFTDKWQNITIVVYTAENSIGVFHNGEYIGSYFFRHYLNNFTTEGITGVTIGRGISNSASSEGLYIDNISILDTEEEGPASLENVSADYNFEGSTSMPSGLSTSATSNIFVESNVPTATGTTNAVKFTSSTVGAKQLSYTLGTGQGTGQVDVAYSIKYSTTDSTPTNKQKFKVYLNTYPTGQAVASDMYNGQLVTYCDGNPNTASIPKSMLTDGWHDIVWHFDFNTNKYTLEFDGEYFADASGNPVEYDMRNPQAEYLTSITMNIEKVDGSTIDPVMYIDNLSVTNKAYYCGMLRLKSLDSSILVKESDLTIGGCPVGSKISALSSVLTSPSVGYKLKFTDKVGNEKTEDDILELDDKVIVYHDNASYTTEYTVKSAYGISFRSLEVNKREFYELEDVNIAGPADLLVKMENNTGSEGEFTAYAAVVGDKLYDVALKKVTIPAQTAKFQEFYVTLPSTPAPGEEIKIKLMLLDDKMTPVCLYESMPLDLTTDISMPNIFSDHMVLQRGEYANIFGIAPSGSDVTVSFNGQEKTGKSVNGEFLIKLDPMQANATGQTLTVTVATGDRTETFTYSDVVVGDVFYGSGQSNMINGTVAMNGTLPEKMPFADIASNSIRYISMSAITSVNQVTPGLNSWAVRTASNFTGMSGTMYGTIWSLINSGIIEEGVPVGVCVAAWGGTAINQWISRPTIKATNVTAWWNEYLDEVVSSRGGKYGDLFYAMVRQNLPYTFKAAVWYQGEANAGQSYYCDVADAMIDEMRAVLGYDIPYYVVQLPGYTSTSWSEFRLTQWKIRDVDDYKFVAVTQDSGCDDPSVDPSLAIHPDNKEVVGDRVARLMGYYQYGKQTPYSGPVFKKATASGNAVTVEFDYANDGIHGKLCSKADDNSLNSFELSADGTTWVAASATLGSDGKTVELTANGVTAPKFVRFAYTHKIVKSLANDNSDGSKLPCAPFREPITD